MNKMFKTLSSLALALVLLVALAIPAFAAETYTVTIDSDTTGHIYEAYQIFAGDLSEGILSNVTWGSGVDGVALLSALKADATVGTTFATATSAAAVAVALDGAANDSAAAKAFAAVAGQHLTTATGTSSEAAGPYTIQGLPAGYYLVKDKNGSQNGEDEAYTRFVLQVVEDVSATPKASTPTVEKKVKENDQYTADGGYGVGYNDAADYNIGDSVPFKLIGTLPSTYADYSSYSYTFHDTLSSGLTYNYDAKVFVDGTEITSSATVTGGDHALTVKFDNLKAIPGVTITSASKITVEYTATLNKGAEIGLDGNTNEVYLEYSNNPNPGGEGNTGETPKDKVIVFTYELDVTKVDGAEITKLLGGAEFQLTNAAGKYAQVGTDGVLTGWTTDAAAATTLISAADTGLFKVIGLDDGIYTLTETKAPAGYNKLENPVEVMIDATTANSQTWGGVAANALTALTVTADTKAGNTDLTGGVASISIANNKGATLPATGGVGTTIFYVVGGVLMLGAVILLVTKKRIGGKD
ncbi:conserved exported hypothetical protein [uncultured Eubacteriales bacterium]|uniref:Uncharacterized protein n=1 Tax=uncultured Eubacteriales bacterium TaxID=172733 RepID=A0A212IWM7_9FIRM|nr:conserved exported hypothetical protein [uncultured Eubacteriales bacterium]